MVEHGWGWSSKEFAAFRSDYCYSFLFSLLLQFFSFFSLLVGYFTIVRGVGLPPREEKVVIRT